MPFRSQPHAIRMADDIVANAENTYIDVTHFDAPEHPDGQRLLAFYNEHLARDTLPRRCEMPNRKIASILPNIFMLEPTNPEATDWRFRLVGQGIVSRLGVDATGTLISQAYAAEQVEQVEHHATVYRAVIKGERLSITRGIIKGIDREHVSLEIVHVPMIGADNETRWVLGGMFFNDEYRSTRHQNAY